MTLAGIVRAWGNGEFAKNANRSLLSTGYSLFSYDVCIAAVFREDHAIYLNTTKYSPTTSKHQMLARTLGVSLRRQHNPGFNVISVEVPSSGYKWAPVSADQLREAAIATSGAAGAGPSGLVLPHDNSPLKLC